MTDDKRTYCAVIGGIAAVAILGALGFATSHVEPPSKNVNLQSVKDNRTAVAYRQEAGRGKTWTCGIRAPFKTNRDQARRKSNKEENPLGFDNITMADLQLATSHPENDNDDDFLDFEHVSSEDKAVKYGADGRMQGQKDGGLTSIGIQRAPWNARVFLGSESAAAVIIGPDVILTTARIFG